MSLRPLTSVLSLTGRTLPIEHHCGRTKDSGVIGVQPLFSHSNRGRGVTTCELLHLILPQWADGLRGNGHSHRFRRCNVDILSVARLHRTPAGAKNVTRAEEVKKKYRSPAIGY